MSRFIKQYIGPVLKCKRPKEQFITVDVMGCVTTGCARYSMPFAERFCPSCSMAPGIIGHEKTSLQKSVHAMLEELGVYEIDVMNDGPHRNKHPDDDNSKFLWFIPNRMGSWTHFSPTEDGDTVKKISDFIIRHEIAEFKEKFAAQIEIVRGTFGKGEITYMFASESR